MTRLHEMIKKPFPDLVCLHFRSPLLSLTSTSCSQPIRRGMGSPSNDAFRPLTVPARWRRLPGR
ncbi:hypothetical protein MOTT27_03140 [Mycobacterium intracellulare subsp. yongonense]|nr:hypothetical protein MOTT27_03140 [Mycobacterium intracellulare subsp. yongonense]